MNDSVGSFLSRPELSLGWVFCCRGNFVQDGPFIVREVFNHGAVVVEDPRNGRNLKINEQKLKPFLGGVILEEETMSLEIPTYWVAK